jgi:transcriptional regulator with XRE-family HTH domain
MMANAIARIIEGLKDRAGLQGEDIANIVAVSPATVSLWSQGKAAPDLHTQTIIADLLYLVERLRDFYSSDETRFWLHSRHPLLNGERAIDLICNNRTEELLAVVERMDSGGFV